MKKDLFTYGLLAIISVIVAYFVCNLFIQPLNDAKIQVLTSTESYTLSDPDPEIFNFRAINPTVEGIVNCEEYDSCPTYSNPDSGGDGGGFMDDYFNSGDNNGGSD